jgi:ABC-type phosphate/phosphonate transport system substrate-binding protein
MILHRHVVSLLTAFIPFVLIAPVAAQSTGVPAQANVGTIQKAAFIQPSQPLGQTPGAAAAAKAETLIFSAPPRESLEAGQETYGPVAEYLSKVLGRKVVYNHPGTWGVYRTKMLQGHYDILFDGPHFNSYRSEKLNHNILAKIAKRHEFAIIVKKDEVYPNVQKMAGRTFCTHAPPNLGTLVLLSQFDNPARQPVIINTKGWDKIYDGVVSGKCVGGILPMLNLTKFNKEGNARIVFKTSAMPNQAFSAGPRILPEDQAKIAAALVSPDGSNATAKLRSTYKVGDSFISASNQEYVGLGEYLKNEWGYY